MTSRFIPMPIEPNFARPHLPRQAGENLSAAETGLSSVAQPQGTSINYGKHRVLIKTDMRRSALRFLPYGKSEDATPIPCIYDRLIGKWRGRLRSGSLQRS